MEKAAKRKNFFSAIIALALLLCASHVASANVLEISKTRAEFKTESVQNRVSESLFYSVKRDVNYDRFEEVASESSVAPNRVFTSADDFAKLGRTGTIAPNSIRFSQDSIGANFQKGRGPISDLTTKLQNGLDPSTIPPIRIVERNGKIFTLDNRRLKAFQDAGVDIPFQKLDSIPKKQLDKFTTVNDGVDIIVRGGNR